MLRPLFISSLALLFSQFAFAQLPESVQTDSVTILNEFTVSAYEYGRSLLDVPASVAIIKASDISRFNETAVVSVLNTVPGVKLEERSPGSYRVSIRGSTLRSPFGVRNVKIYWNELPFTDPGGNTYLNLIDPGAIGEIEVVKGPGSSLYGAGTGGVLLLKHGNTSVDNLESYATAVVGSYGLIRSSVGMNNHSNRSQASIHYAHQQSEGYRDQSAMRKDVIHTQGSYRISDRRTIGANFLYADLFYETPGGLTLKQYNEDRRQARPAGGPNASAVAQQAAIYNKTIYAGVSQTYDITDRWSNRTGAYLSFTRFENPAIRNYERRTEQSFGARSTTQYKGRIFHVTVGGEFQNGFSPIKTYSNKGGDIDTLQTDSEISAMAALIFAQAEIFLPHQFFITLGASFNFYDIQFKELSLSPVIDARRNFTPVFSPRLAVLKKLTSSLSVHASFSRGFSPPTVAELFPSVAIFNDTLQAEKGDNFEIGLRGQLLRNLTVDVAAYSFKLKDAITTRRTDDGGEFFTNVGGTSQTGIELNVVYAPTFSEGSFVSAFKLWASVTINRYTFDQYVKDTVNTQTGQVAPADYSGNKLTGVSPNVIVLGTDLLLRPKLYCNVTASYTDEIPLDDGNTAFAEAYFLLGGRIGYRPRIKRITLDLFFGGDNLLNEKYSLGNDINALSNRFYNAAPGRNFFAGLKMSFNKKAQ